MLHARESSELELATGDVSGIRNSGRQYKMAKGTEVDQLSVVSPVPYALIFSKDLGPFPETMPSDGA